MHGTCIKIVAQIYLHPYPYKTNHSFLPYDQKFRVLEENIKTVWRIKYGKLRQIAQFNTQSQQQFPLR